MLKILIKPRAKEDLKNIYLYSLKEFGKTKTTEYVGDLDKAFNKLANNCNLGNDYSVISPQTRAYKATSHLIFYKISEDQISIIRVLHKSMDHKKHL